MNIKVTIIEDHPDLRESLYYILQSTDGFECIGQFPSIEEALEEMRNSDILLLDINLPGKSGLEGIPLIREKFPSIIIIILTVFEDDKKVFEAVSAGADGYLLKKTPPAKLLQSIEEAHNGGSPMSPLIARKVLKLFKNFIPVQNNSGVLSVREIEILNCLVNGLSNSEISDKLFISEQTVKNHIRHIYEKLHVHSKSQAVVKAIREGIV